MSGSILWTHEDSPIDVEKIKVFFSNSDEYLQWTESKICREKGENMG